MQFSSERLKAARKRAHLTQKSLSLKAGVSMRSLAGWETGSEPSTENLKKLCKALQLELHTLFIAEPRITPGQSVAGGLLVHEDGSLRKVPVVSWAAAGKAHDYEDLSNQIEDVVESSTKDPNAFALIIEGDSMEPRFQAGDIVVFSPNSEPRNNNFVVARLKEDHGVMFKKFRRTGPEGQVVVLESLNTNYKSKEYPMNAFRYIYPAVEMKVRLNR